ncbi:ABC transporter permease [Nonomuraea spiralis]|uniref:ABC transporter permease n=1 Tax=Nonomuraea spiralis TaxID=46182 RepID=A0ABV5IB77_9ACTN|nr:MULTISPECIES: ABC transporter permease [Nonomuraea]GGT05911.1 ABC transporter permease [Nonomuraea spiralis]
MSVVPGTVRLGGRARRLRRARPGPVTLLSGGVLALMAAAALLGTWIAPYDPAAQDLALGATMPGWAHWAGTDELGRDVLSRCLAGARSALLWPVVVALCTCAMSTSLGLLAGYRRGWIDAVMMRVVDLLIAMPGLLMLIVLVGVLGGGIGWAVLAIAVLFTPGDIRVVRSLTMAQRELAYAEAARTLGLGRARIMFRHLLPNIAPTVVAGALLSFVAALVALSGLSFLGIGLPAGTPDWGLMIEENRGLLDLNPWAAVVPAALVTVAATAATLLGDQLFERLSDA